jgi:membrane-associated HD superfamily phosphohydrolase
LRGLSLNSTFMCLWAIYIFPRSVNLFSCSRIGRPIRGIVAGSLWYYYPLSYSIALRVYIIGLHYTAWALVKTVELSTIQLSLVGILYCNIPYIVYCFGLASCRTKLESYMSTVTQISPSIHLSLTSLFISCHSLYPNIYHISYTVKKSV